MIRVWRAGRQCGVEPLIRFRNDEPLRLVMTNGCFSTIHAGHIATIEGAYRYSGSRGIILAFNTVESIHRTKGYDRDSVLSDQSRGSMLSALPWVAFAVEQEADTPLELIATFRPAILCKGGTTDDIVGSEFVLSYGGKVIRLPEVNCPSSSETILGEAIQ